MKTSDIDREFAYGPKWRHIIGVATFGAALSAPFVHWARANRNGLVINHVLELDVEQATLFFYCMAGALGLVAGLGLLNGVLALGGKRRVALARGALVVPRGRFSREEKHIAYRDIDGLTVRDVRGFKYLDVHHSKRTDCIVGAWTDSREEFEELLGTLADRVASAGQGALRGERGAKTGSPAAS
jgi:hypothetical protein